jgi:cytoskeletal protein CcmA (bactofilin family)
MFKNDRPGDPKDLPKPGLRPALYDPPIPPAKPLGTGVRSGLPPPPPAPREQVAPPPPSEHAPAASSTPRATPPSDGSKLSIGVNIKLKGVEISDCDVLVIEGQVEATVHSKVMQIDQPGTLNGTALIDIAEIRGEFSGELTARTRLVVHGTGRVSGTVRYGKLIVEEGGELTGDVKRLDPQDAQRSLLPSDARRSSAAEPVSPPPNPAYSATARSHPG